MIYLQIHDVLYDILVHLPKYTMLSVARTPFSHRNKAFALLYDFV